MAFHLTYLSGRPIMLRQSLLVVVTVDVSSLTFFYATARFWACRAARRGNVVDPGLFQFIRRLMKFFFRNRCSFGPPQVVFLCDRCGGSWLGNWAVLR